MRYILTVLTAIAVFQVPAAATGRASEPLTMEEQRAKEIRVLVDGLLFEVDLLVTELLADASLSSIDCRFNLGVFQEGEAIESGSRDPIDYDHDGDVDEADLARAAQNPIADMISLPFQNNLNFDVGALNHEQNVLNIQPVIPFSLNDDWNLITRTIVPVVYQPAFFPGDDHDFGIGDIQFTGFLSPKKPVGGWSSEPARSSNSRRRPTSDSARGSGPPVLRPSRFAWTGRGCTARSLRMSGRSRLR